VEFYSADGFVRLPDSPRLALPMRLALGVLNDDVVSRSAPWIEESSGEAGYGLHRD
jgi:hypothetical protein